MDNTTMALIGTGALSVGLVWNKAEKVMKAMKECADVLSTLAHALDDKTITPEEMADIKKEMHEAVGAIRGIIQ